MDVSIIYVNYKTGKLILDSIRSVKEKTEGVSYEIIVVDNHSGDDSVEKLKETYPEIRMIESVENVGFGRANNLGIKEAKGTVLFFLNPDTLLVNNAVKFLFDFLMSKKDIGACGGNLVDISMRPVNSFGRLFPSFYEEILSIFYLKPFVWRQSKSLSYNYTFQPLEVASIVGADLMMKRSVLEKTGAFCPDFFMNFEETELCYRIKKAGYRVVSVPEAKIIHLEGQATYIDASRVQRFFEGQYVFFRKRYGRGGMVLLYRIIALKCNLRKIQFILLGSEEKREYWKVKSRTNKKVFKSLVNKKP